MLEKILKLYTMCMGYDVRSPTPHLFGPPGCGKSTVVEQAAELLGVNLHVINVSRISPLELEGVQMPVDMDTEQMKLKLLTATFWTQLKEGDILLLDEFLRGFPEVYNGLLDILTSRQVGGFKLPKVFIIAASNSVTTYDQALEDRLLHLPVADVRTSKPAQLEQALHLISALGLLPEMVKSQEMVNLIHSEVAPMYTLLDQLQGQGAKVSQSGGASGKSMRNLIGQALMREVTSTQLMILLNVNNQTAVNTGKVQYVLLYDAKAAPASYEKKARPLQDHAGLTDQQKRNIKYNLELLELESIRKEKGTEEDDIFLQNAGF